jgi:hypothetical protein
MIRLALGALVAAISLGAQAQMDHEHGGDNAMLMWHWQPWIVTAHGIVNAVVDDQGGPRGGDKRFSNSMAMAIAARDAGSGRLTLKAMLSLDPAMGAAGYPLLFQAGESADGQTLLVDRQHPHDAFMELSAQYQWSVAENTRAWIYGGLPGEPALGPETFMHRLSGLRIPEAPLTHHWLDSTHITMGVVTAGVAHGSVKLEASRFNGREPDEHRWNIETRGFDSWSARVTYEPVDGLTLQASHGYLDSPEALEPAMQLRRTTVSASWASPSLAVTVAWGRNDKEGHGPRRKLDGWLLEATGSPVKDHTFFTRIEQVQQDELFEGDHPLHGRVFDVGKITLGYIYDFARTGTARWSVGALASAFAIPAEMRPYYGAHPHAYMAFLQVRF